MVNYKFKILLFFKRFYHTMSCSFTLNFFFPCEKALYLHITNYWLIPDCQSNIIFI